MNNKFKVTSEAEVPVTLTISGTFTYEGITYTSMTWVEVTTKEAKEIKWVNPSGELTLNSENANTGGIRLLPNKAIFTLKVPADCISDEALTTANFTIIPVSVADTQSYTDEEISEYATTDEIAEVKSVTRSESDPAIYNVEIQGNRTGMVKVNVDVTGLDGTTKYTDSFTLTVKSPVTDQRVDETDDTDSVISDWNQQPDSDDGSGQDESSGWQDNTEDYVDIIPNESYDNSTEDESGWESGE